MPVGGINLASGGEALFSPVLSARGRISADRQGKEGRSQAKTAGRQDFFGDYFGEENYLSEICSVLENNEDHEFRTTAQLEDSN
ncbi:MAG: hypothetical protein IJR64_03515 [Bacteroidales bacterium]|nr:hypothetical protein [Bacteroidales bacterium]